MNEIAKEFRSKGVDVQVEVKDFTNVSIEECIKRDLQRANSVGERVIRNMYNQFLRPKPPVIEHNSNLPDCVICDIDGTLALFGDANPYDRDFTKDTLNKPVSDMLGKFSHNAMRIKDYVILLSGRMDKFREQTEQWLESNGIYYDALYMRKTDDIRKDFVIKKELYQNHIEGKYNVLFILDDRNQVVDMWRSEGLTVFQVAEGDF